MAMINVFQPAIGSVELARVKDVFDSNWIGKGPITDQFEAAFAMHIGAERSHVISVSSCTEGLFLSMRLIGLLPGDEVVLPSISFVGAANAVMACGAKPVFCDVDAKKLNPTLDNVLSAVTTQTRAVVLLHYAGVPCEEIKEIALYCERYGIFLIEDSACSVASTVYNQACGTFGDIGIWSFDAMKILSTVEGGMMYFRDPNWADAARTMTNCGMSVESGYTSTSDKWWEFDVVYPSGKAMMNDVASAIGLVQLERLPVFIERRKNIHAAYNEILKGQLWIDGPQDIPPHCKSSYYLYHVQTNHRDHLGRYLRENGVYTTFRYYPLHRVKMYDHKRGSLFGAGLVADKTLCLPLHQGLSDEDVIRICNLLLDFEREVMP